MSFRDVSKQILESFKDIRIADSIGLRAKPKEIVPMKIPNGYPNDYDRTVLDKNNEPSIEALNDFFSEKTALSRLILCPQINKDLLDDWGISGYEPGFIFIVGNCENPLNTLASEAWATQQTLNWDPIDKLPIIGHYDFFPKFSLKHQIITPTETPRTFTFLYKLFHQPPCLRAYLPDGGVEQANES